MNTSSRMMSQQSTHNMMAMQTDHYKTTGRHFVLFRTTGAVIVTTAITTLQEARPFFTQKHRSSQQRGLRQGTLSRTSLKCHN